MKLSKEQLEKLSRLEFPVISTNDVCETITLELMGTRFDPSDPIPLTHFEILKLDAVFMDVRDNEMSNHWDNTRASLPDWRYCLTIDYIGAVTMDDVVWLKLEREA